MLLERIRSELVRLELHSVNLGVSLKDDRLVALRGSLLQYWKIPKVIDGHWFLGILQALPDAAGPQVVMTALCQALAGGALSTASERGTALKLFDPASKEPQEGPR